MTLQQMAQSALDVQSACNLSGVVLSLARIVESMRGEHGFDTPTCNRHSVCRLYAEQISHLAGSGMGDMITYDQAYETCQRMAKGGQS